MSVFDLPRLHFAGTATTRLPTGPRNGLVDFTTHSVVMVTGVMRPLAELLVTVPSGRHGRTTGPPFELDEKPAFISRPDVARRSISLRFQHLAEAARKCTLAPDVVIGNLEFLADQFATEGP